MDTLRQNPVPEPLPPLQDRILLRNRQPSWTCEEIAMTLAVPGVMVNGRVRSMARNRWFNTRGPGGDTAVDITSEGKAALADLLGRRERRGRNRGRDHPSTTAGTSSATARALRSW